MNRSKILILVITTLLVITGVLVSSISCATSTDDAGNIILIAENGKFNKGTIRADISSLVSIAFDNKDNVSHNFAVYRSKEAIEEIYVGDVVEAGMTIIYKFTAPDEPGVYFFRCDLHPETMTGTFNVYGTGS